MYIIIDPCASLLSPLTHPPNKFQFSVENVFLIMCAVNILTLHTFN